ncbi:MAG: tetratricopeptide repeat protein [Polyangiaceae bacterium]|jgi:tetratricopeptide (TPR) repeat protein
MIRGGRRAATAFAAIAAIVASACVGPSRGKEYVAAYAAGEAAVGAGRFAEGATHFDEAARTAKVPRDGDHARYLAARALANAGNRADAATRLRAIADASPPLEDSAEAANAICEMQVARGGELEAEENAWSCFVDVAKRFPSSGIARPALRRMIAHEDRERGAQATLEFIEKLAPAFERTDLAETIAYETALHLATLGEGQRALDGFLAMTKRWSYPHGAFWDDGLYRASLLEEKLGHVDEAMRLLTQMLAERESSWIMGTYERPRYEPAMVRLCALTRDRLHDRPRARECFHKLYRDFTTSELRDDALWEEARLFREDGDPTSACSRLATLASDFPDSRYVPCAMAECSGVTRPKKSGAPIECHPYIAHFRLGGEDAM